MCPKTKYTSTLGQPALTNLGIGTPLEGNNANFIVLPILRRDQVAKGPRDDARGPIVL